MMLKKIDAALLKQIILVVCITIIGGIIFFSLIDFFADFLGALIIYVLFRPITKYLIEKRKWKRGLTSLLVMLITILLLVVPLTLLFNMFIPKLQHLFSDSSVITQTLQTLDNKVYDLSGQRFMNPDNLKSLQISAADYIRGFLSQSISVLGDIGIMLLFLYYLLSNTGKLERFVVKLLPVKQSDLARFTEELKAQTFSNVLGAPVLATLQGLVAALGYWIFGVNEPLFWGIITGFFSFIPMVGGALILYGVFVISMIDNVLRFAFQKKFADVHPLITVMGVILGIKLFGLPGMIFGPLLISYFLLLTSIYKEQFLDAQLDPVTAESTD
jgi:predicted PurR-regulated permease PerM